VVLTAYQIRQDLADAREERAIRLDNAIDRRWDRLLRPASGNIGKGEALSFLFQQGVSFNGVDLSCQAIGTYSFSDGICRRSPIFTDLNLVEDEPMGATPRYIRNVSLRDAEIHNAQFRNVMVWGLDVGGASISGATFSNAVIQGRFAGASMVDVVAVSSIVEAPNGEKPASFTGNISGSSISFLREFASTTGIWAWADHPPVHRNKQTFSLFNLTGEEEAEPDEVLANIELCDPPIDEAGKPLPLSQRNNSQRHVISEFIHMFRVCKRLTLAEAKERFPDAFKRTKPINLLEVYEKHIRSRPGGESTLKHR